MKKRKRILAGSIGIECDMPVRQRGDSIKERAAKAKATSAAQKRMNQLNSMMELELRLAANFPLPGSGLWVTLTHDDAHMPGSRKEAQLRFKYFLKKLRAARKAADLPEPVVFWAPEILTSESGRWHQHVVMDSTGRDFDLIRACWIYGSDVEIRKLGIPDPGEKLPAWYDPEAEEPGNYFRMVAKYMTKELRECQEYETKPGLHGWSCTRNAKKPEVDTLAVPDDFRLEPPEGAAVYLDKRESTEWATYQVLKFRLNGSDFGSVPRARRRRSRRA
jgi:hypothetical protein